LSRAGQIYLLVHTAPSMQGCISAVQEQWVSGNLVLKSNVGFIL